MKALSPAFQTSSHSPATSKCCSTGHPVMVDPLTGRTTCSCQLATGSVPSYLTRVPTLPESMYAGHSAAHIAMLQRHLLANSLYSQRLDGHTMKAAPPSAHQSFHYDHVMAAHPYAAMYGGFDINGMKRKNATRESTSALKAWLFQHRKNPYPTKAEKVMLAIVSQMTLTQVSTWFANARRRLKKESKSGDGEFDIDDVDDKQSTSRLSDYDSDASISDRRSKPASDVSDCSDAEDQTTKTEIPANSCYQRLFSPDSRNELFLERISSPTGNTGNDVKNIENSLGVQLNESKCGCVDTGNNNTNNSDKDGISTLNQIPIDVKDNIPSSAAQNKASVYSKKIWSIAHIIG